MPDFLFRLKTLFPVILFALLLVPAAARAEDASVQTAWRLLDYLAVDYRGAVADGRIVSQSEYGEMREFADSVTRRISTLPANPQRAALLAEARTLQAAIAARARAAEIERSAHALAARLLTVYPVPLAPRSIPDLARGAQLYAQNCASCHGATGLADTPAARALDPHPVKFADRARARQRSLFGLYQVIGQGVEGAAMQGFAGLPEQERWGRAFHIGRVAHPGLLVEGGAAQL